MNFYVTFFESERNSKQEPEVPKGQTEIFLNYEPEIGENITLDFPNKYLKNNKWFSHLPKYPYTIFSIQPVPGTNETVLFAFYSGEDEVDFDQIAHTYGR